MHDSPAVVDLTENEGNQANVLDILEDTEGRNNEQGNSQNFNGPFQSTVKGKCRKKVKRPDWTPQQQPTDPRFGCGINKLEGYETDDDSPNLFAKNADGTFACN